MSCPAILTGQIWLSAICHNVGLYKARLKGDHISLISFRDGVRTFPRTRALCRLPGVGGTVDQKKSAATGRGVVAAIPWCRKLVSNLYCKDNGFSPIISRICLAWNLLAKRSYYPKKLKRRGWKCPWIFDIFKMSSFYHLNLSNFIILILAMNGYATSKDNRYI